MSVVAVTTESAVPTEPGAVRRRASAVVDTVTAATVKPVVRWGLGHALPRRVMNRTAARGDLHGRLVAETGYSAGTAHGTPDDARLLALFEEIRAAGPLHRGRYAFVTASQEVVKEVLTSPDFRTGIDLGGGGPVGRLVKWAIIPGQLGPLSPPSLLVTEPPDHTRYRKLVTRVFTVKAVEQLRVRTQEIADGLLDRLERDHPGEVVELVEAYCALLPVTVIAEILGVPAEHHARVLEFGTAAAPSLDMGLTWADFRSVEKGLAAFDAWLTDHLDHLRRHPGDDLMSRLVAVRDDDGTLDDAELKATAGLVLAAGFETTVNLLGNGVSLLAAHPDQRALLRERPELWANTVDEVLRADPPVLLTGRTAARDTEVAGVAVPRGALVTTVLAAANRDPSVFLDPGAFDVGRDNARDHLAFSAGRHYCLGAALARMEGEVGLRTLFERYPDLVVEPGATRRTTRILRGFARLPVRLRP